MPLRLAFINWAYTYRSFQSVEFLQANKTVKASLGIIHYYNLKAKGYNKIF